jgi:hypothetical protein
LAKKSKNQIFYGRRIFCFSLAQQALVDNPDDFNFFALGFPGCFYPKRGSSAFYLRFILG